MIKGCSIPQIIRFKGEVKLNQKQNNNSRLNSDAIPFLGNGAGLNSDALSFVPGKQILAQCQVSKGNGLNSDALPFVPNEQTLAQCQVSKGNGLNLGAESSVAKGKEDPPARTEYSDKEERILDPRIEAVITFYKYDTDGTENPKTVTKYPEGSNISKKIKYHNNDAIVTFYKDGRKEEFYKYDTDGQENLHTRTIYPEGSEIEERTIFHNTGDTITKYRDGTKKEVYKLDIKGREAPHTRTIYPEGSEMKEYTIFHNTGDNITIYNNGISIKENKLEGLKTASVKNQQNNKIDFLWEKIDAENRNIIFKDETGLNLSFSENINKTFMELAIKFAERFKSLSG